MLQTFVIVSGVRDILVRFFRKQQRERVVNTIICVYIVKNLISKALSEIELSLTFCFQSFFDVLL